MIRRILVVSALLLVGVLASSGNAKADELTLSGTTSANPPSGITFLPGSFSGTTSGGFAGFSNIGAFTLSSTPATYSGTIDLQVAFSVPTGISGGGASNFIANLFGNVSNTATGGVDIAFSNPTQFFTFSNSTGSGSFNFTVNNVSLNPGGTTAVSASVTGGVFTPVPEPASIALLALGLLGVAVLALSRSGLVVRNSLAAN